MAGGPQSSGWIADLVRHWVIVPANPTGPGNIGFVVLIVSAHRARAAARHLAHGAHPDPLYLAVCVWEARLVAEPRSRARSSSARSSS